MGWKQTPLVVDGEPIILDHVKNVRDALIERQSIPTIGGTPPTDWTDDPLYPYAARTLFWNATAAFVKNARTPVGTLVPKFTDHRTWPTASWPLPWTLANILTAATGSGSWRTLKKIPEAISVKDFQDIINLVRWIETATPFSEPYMGYPYRRFVFVDGTGTTPWSELWAQAKAAYASTSWVSNVSDNYTALYGTKMQVEISGNWVRRVAITHQKFLVDFGKFGLSPEEVASWRIGLKSRAAVSAPTGGIGEWGGAALIRSNAGAELKRYSAPDANYDFPEFASADYGYYPAVIGDDADMDAYEPLDIPPYTTRANQKGWIISGAGGNPNTCVRGYVWPAFEFLPPVMWNKAWDTQEWDAKE